MKVIDFRARPNTSVYMKMYDGPSRVRFWQRFGHPQPPSVPLSEFVSALDRVGLDLAVFTGRQSYHDGKIAVGFPNEYVAECSKQSGGKIIGFAGIDAGTGPAAVREVERAVNELGLRGVSLDAHLSGIGPGDQRVYPIYQKAMELKVPVVLTMGPLVGKWGDPWPVDQVAVDFPDLNIVCSHGCYPQVTEWIALAWRRDNVYLEASIYEFLPGAEPFIDAANTIIQDRVVYASAFPFNPLETLERFLKLPLGPVAQEKVLYGNAARLLRLS